VTWSIPCALPFDRHTFEVHVRRTIRWPDQRAAGRNRARGRHPARPGAAGYCVGRRPGTGHEFEDWLADPPAEALEIFEELVTALTQTGAARTPDAAAGAYRQAVQKFRERRKT
jgi:hypothetical protein